MNFVKVEVGPNGNGIKVLYIKFEVIVNLDN